jgi:hypothetical protein
MADVHIWRFRDMLCTQYTANSTFCVPSILGNIQTASGSNITINEIVSLVSGNVTPAGKAFANVPSVSALCLLFK